MVNSIELDKKSRKGYLKRQTYDDRQREEDILSSKSGKSVLSLE